MDNHDGGTFRQALQNCFQDSPGHDFNPRCLHIIVIISLVVLAGRVLRSLSAIADGEWRSTYVASATVALFFNVFVLAFQSFLKIPGLKARAPTQSEPPFGIAQGARYIAVRCARRACYTRIPRCSASPCWRSLTTAASACAQEEGL
jgi:hypothetical protein